MNKIATKNKRGWATGSALLTTSAMMIASLMLGGCPAEGVGDPCSPEAVPQEDISASQIAEGITQGRLGFTETDIFLETSSVQCRTRVCMAFRLEGHPDVATDTGTCVPSKAKTSYPRAGDDPFSPPLNVNKCPKTEEVDKRVFCTCRCGGEGDSPLCDCPDGFSCQPIIESGGEGLRGSYCVKNSLVDEIAK